MPKKKVTKKEDDFNEDPLDQTFSNKKYKNISISGDEPMLGIDTNIISTGSVLFDNLIGGGFRPGWSRFSGPAESGKTSQGLAWGRQWLNHFDNGLIIYIDAEGRVSPELLKRSGIDYEDKQQIRMIDGNYGAEIYDMLLETAINSKGRRYFYILDSADALIAPGDEGKSFSDPQKIGGAAVLNSAMGKMVSGKLRKHGHHLYVINQVRVQMKKRGPAMNTYDGVSGGNALTFYSSLTGAFAPLYAKNMIYEKHDDYTSKKIGQFAQIKLDKTYNETSGSEIRIPIKKGRVGGVWREREAVEIVIGWDLYTGAGAWKEASELYLEEMKERGVEAPPKVQGISGLNKLFDSDPDLVEATIDFFNKYSFK